MTGAEDILNDLELDEPAPRVRAPREASVSRQSKTRDAAERPKSWQLPELLPEPDKQPGYVYRWVRVALLNQADATNVSAKMREGWEPVRIEEQPQFQLFRDPNSRFTDGIEISGLLLCKMPEEFKEQRDAHYRRVTQSQMDSVDNDYMRLNDPRMPLFSERKSTTSFGKGK